MSNYPPGPEGYEPVDYAAIPVGVKWKPSRGKPGPHTRTMYSTPGNTYKLIRQLDTGDVAYFKLKDTGPEKSPAEKIDAEPQKKGQVRYRVGSYCWLVLDGLWFCCEVMKRGREPGTTVPTIELRPTTGWDADRKASWPHGETLTFSARTPLFKHLRPLKARQS